MVRARRERGPVHRLDGTHVDRRGGRGLRSERAATLPSRRSRGVVLLWEAALARKSGVQLSALVDRCGIASPLAAAHRDHCAARGLLALPRALASAARRGVAL